MAHTVTQLNDHAGFSGPKVVGHEYYSDAYVTVTVVTAGGEVINASDFGLSSISQVVLTGNSLPATYDVDVQVSASGAYASSSTFKLLFTAMDGTNAAAEGDITDTTVRVRLYGLL